MNVPVTKEDLIGQIANFPLKIVEAMVTNQVRQGNPANVKVFQEKADASFVEGGFSWNKSAEGQFFWSKVINGKQFPKEIVPPDKSIELVNESPEVTDNVRKPSYRMGEVLKDNGKQRIVIGYFPEMPNPYITITKQTFDAFTRGEINSTVTIIEAIKEPEKYVYLTLKDISEGRGVGINPDLIKIVQ